MKRYDLAIDYMLSDDAATMYLCPDGKYVSFEDYQRKMDFAIEILMNLKASDVSKNTPAELNMIVDVAIENLRSK